MDEQKRLERYVERGFVCNQEQRVEVFFESRVISVEFGERQSAVDSSQDSRYQLRVGILEFSKTSVALDLLPLLFLRLSFRGVVLCLRRVLRHIVEVGAVLSQNVLEQFKVDIDQLSGDIPIGLRRREDDLVERYRSVGTSV